MVTSALQKYEVILTPSKCSAMYPEQEKIMMLTTVVEKLNDNNIKLSKSIKTTPKKQKLK